MDFSEMEHELFQKIMSEVKDRRENKITTEFSLPDLFSLNEWEHYHEQSRRKVGKRFKAKVDLNEIQNIVYCGQNDKDWAIYKIVF